MTIATSPPEAAETSAPQPVPTDPAPRFYTDEEFRQRPPVPLTPERITELTAQLAATVTGRVSLEVDPDDLVFGRNIRTDAIESLTADLLCSIAENGFEQSPTAWINPYGFLQVRVGHRRTLAARRVSYRPCPVILVPPPQGDTPKQQRCDEIGTQWDENEHRAAMTEADRIGAVDEMLDLGMSVTKVAQRLKTVTREEVNAVKRIRTAKAPDKARDAQMAGLDIVQAAVAAELDPSDEEMTRLVKAAANDDFDRSVIAIGRRRRADAALAQARDAFAAKGYTILDHEPRYYDTDKPTPISELATHGGRKATVKDVTSPSHWSLVLSHEEQPILIATGEPVEADSVDQRTYLDPTAQPAEGLHHADEVRFEPTIKAHHYCNDRKGAGLKVVRAGGTPNTDQGESNRRARKANEAARIDTEARRLFITATLLKRKTLPKGFIQWIAHEVLADPDALTKQHARGFAADWFGIGSGMGRFAKLSSVSGYDDTLPADKQKTTDQRGLILIAGTFIAATEAGMQPNEKQPHYWRITQANPHVCYLGDANASARYLRVLAAAGYKPGPIERAVMGEITLTDALAEADAQNT
ncbi:ParB/RepB/Spo0J family partition protein [Nocardia sp. NBC_01327]|uniref:ParB/RepB/Spo0J family partition protein n=1 Tax=Nocardia sp. NBC_01327 TaxID=2903593 RepID=UPI002E105FDC|nr:ParB/RepB/Spo0J family partition protein [Nocardia sp. NBC_01327]